MNHPALKASAQQKKTYEDSYKKMQTLQKERQEHQAAQGQLNTQMVENKTVAEEIKLLKDDDVIYKLVGPALIKQDNAEVKLNVDNRIKHIEGEIKRHQKAIEAGDQESQKVVTTMKTLETALLQKMQEAGLVEKNK